MNWEDVIVEAVATDTGMRRSNNQDSYAIVRATGPETWRTKGHLFMVADGMGAHAVGELASKLACDNIPHHYTKSKATTPTEALTRAYREVGGLIHSKSSANKDFEGMGTTATALVLGPAGALIAHVGDTRIYRIRDGRIDQLSFDHSLVWELVRRNHLSLEKASKAVPRNVITRSLGPDPHVEVDIEGPLPVGPGDVYLLCSDGLCGLVTDPELGAFATSFHPNDACQYLLHLANIRGGQDNITVLIVRVGPWVEPGTETASPGPAATAKPGRGFSLAGLLGSIKGKPAAPEVEEHIYAAAECPLTVASLDGLVEDIRGVKEAAIENSWPVDWPKLALLIRAAEAKKGQGDLRAALRDVGEAITMIGIAGRVHRKHRAVDGAY